MEDPELPSWLDASLLATALQGGEEKVPQVVVTKFSAALAVSAGTNYTSRMYRVRVYYKVEEEEKNISIIIKVPFTNGVMDSFVGQGDFYNKEPKIYKDLLPIMDSLVNCEFGPRTYYNCVNNALLLSDLKEQGYEMCDRYKQLDFPHCKQVLIKLAKFHAASVACKKHHPELIEEVGREPFYNDSDQFKSNLKPWIESTTTFVAGVINELELSKEIEDFILTRAESISDSLIKLCKPKTSGLNVLNHGDLWINNMLFKYTSSGGIADVMFIDFQIAKYTSPVLDIIYFVWSSANEDVRESQLQELCEIYRLTLNSTLMMLQLEERLTEEELQGDLRNSVDWVILTICNTLPFIVCEVEDVINVEEIDVSDLQSEVDEKFLRLHKGKSFRALLPKITTHFLAWLRYYKCL